MPEIEDLQNQTEELRRQLAEIQSRLESPIEKVDKTKFSNLDDDLNFLEVVSSIPTDVPTNPLKKIVIYVSGTTYRLYVYDNKNNIWRFVNLS